MDLSNSFLSNEYLRLLKGHEVTSSMSGIGSCADNALVEDFLGILKRERVN